MIHIHQSRTYSLQILKNSSNNSSEQLFPPQKHLYAKADKSYSSKIEDNISQIVKEHSQLKLALTKVSDDALQLVDKISARKNAKIPIKINFMQHIEHNNQKIEKLYTQIKKTENKIHIFSDKQKYIEKTHSRQQIRRNQLKSSIKYLNKKIENNSKQLLEQKQANNFTIFDLQKQILQLNIRMKHIRQKNINAVQNNQQKVKKIKQIQAKIMDYQSSNILRQIDQQNRKQNEYILKMKQLQKLKVASTRQRGRLQHLYYRKLKDFQYQIACCQAIDQKIKELQMRMIYNQVEGTGQNHHFMKIVKSHRMLSKNKRCTSEQSLNNDQSSGQPIMDTYTFRKLKPRQNTTVQVNKQSNIGKMEEVKKRRIMSGIQPLIKDERLMI